MLVPGLSDSSGIFESESSGLSDLSGFSGCSGSSGFSGSLDVSGCDGVLESLPVCPACSLEARSSGVGSGLGDVKIHNKGNNPKN